jgi:single-strand DNA-binding protein
MKKGLNKVMLIGWLDGDPETRYTPNGRAVTSFSISTPRTWTSSEGERVEEAEWFNIVAWGALAEVCQQHFVKGDQVYVEGRLQTRGWEDSNGRKHFRTEVVAHEVIVLSGS